MRIDTRYIECDEHGPHRHAYVICKHLLASGDRSQIGHHAPWSDDPNNGMGELLCSIPIDKHGLDGLKVICEDHLFDMGLLLPGEKMLS